MSKLPSLKRGDIVTAFKNLGFMERRQRGSHLSLKHPDGRLVVIAVHAGKEMFPGAIRRLIRQARVSEEDFLLALKKRID